jgi:hypothetical protein
LIAPTTGTGIASSWATICVIARASACRWSRLSLANTRVSTGREGLSASSYAILFIRHPNLVRLGAPSRTSPARLIWCRPPSRIGFAGNLKQRLQAKWTLAVPAPKSPGAKNQTFTSWLRVGPGRCSGVFEMSSKAWMLGVVQAIGVFGILNTQSPKEEKFDAERCAGRQGPLW